MAILDVQHIEKHFGDTSVLKDISFSLEEGQALSIIGSSGSGKTTLLRCLNFLETPDQGVISVRGKTLFDAADPDTRREADIRKKRLHFGLVFQSFNLFPQYTAKMPFWLTAGRCWRRWALPTAWRTIPTSCPVDSSSAWPLPARWP